MINKKTFFFLGLLALFFTLFSTNSHATGADRVPIDTITTNTPYGSCYRISKDTTNNVSFDQCATIIYNQYGEFWNNFYYEGLPSTIGDEIPFYGTLISQNKNAFIGRFTYQYDVEGSRTECTDEDYPYDGLDGYCYPNSDFEDTFVIDQAAIDAFNQRAAELAGTATIQDVDFDDSQIQLDNQQQLGESALGLLAQANSDLSAQSLLNNEIVSNADFDPTSATLAQDSLTSQALLSDSINAYDNAYESTSDLLNIVDSSENAAASNEVLGPQIDSKYDYLVAEIESAQGCDGQACYDDAKDNIDNVIIELDDDLEEQDKNTNIITTNTETVQNTYNNVQTSTTTVTNNYGDTITTSSSSQTTINNGETCVGDSCATTPDPTEPSEETGQFNDRPSDKAASFVESDYPDGLSGVITEQFEKIQEGAFYDSATSAFTVTSVGSSEPSYNMCFNLGFMGNFGCFDLSVDSYIWGIIKAMLLIITIFACRKIIFGG